MAGAGTLEKPTKKEPPILDQARKIVKAAAEPELGRVMEFADIGLQPHVEGGVIERTAPEWIIESEVLSGKIRKLFDPVANGEEFVEDLSTQLHCLERIFKEQGLEKNPGEKYSLTMGVLETVESKSEGLESGERYEKFKSFLGELYEVGYPDYDDLLPSALTTEEKREVTSTLLRNPGDAKTFGGLGGEGIIKQRKSEKVFVK